jgi:asparagine synthase (glutamine-hydrolysing)
MCGLAGIASTKIDQSLVLSTEQMVATIGHRGPDSSGVKNLGNCVLGNTRLAIVDLSERGRQPLCNEDATVWITYNGECYNAEEYRQYLIQRGHKLKSRTDTEIILHMYEEFGDHFAGRLRGMFAFAIWDTCSKKLLVVRDRLGIKPLYYSLTKESIVFGSEIKALLASGLVPRKLSRVGVSAFLQLGHVPPPCTAIQGVTPLEPGHVGIWQDGNWQTTAYWTLPLSDGSAQQNPATIADELRDILLESSKSQLMADVPIALFLSGGVDSAVIGALMRKVGAEQLTALTIGFQEESFDESKSSRRTAELLGVSHRVIKMPASRMKESLDHALWAMDQPTIDGLNAYWISRAAAQEGFKVAISGQGGDELFGGYDSIAWFKRFSGIANCLKRFPASFGEKLLDHQDLPFRWRKLSYLVGSDDPFVGAQLAVRLLFLNKDVHQLLNSALTFEGTAFDPKQYLSEIAELSMGRDLSERTAFLDFPAHLEARLLRDGDAMSMAHSLEVRPVLLDHRVVDFVLSLPSHIRLRNKRLLLEATRDCMPLELFKELELRPKRTFTFPFTRWLNGELRPVIEETFRAERLSSSGILQPNAVAKLWHRYIEEPKAIGWSRLWCVFVLARWCELMRVEV